MISIKLKKDSRPHKYLAGKVSYKVFAINGTILSNKPNVTGIL